MKNGNVVNCDYASFWTSTSEDKIKIKDVPVNSKVSIIETNDEWTCVKLEDGSVGWIETEYVEETKEGCEEKSILLSVKKALGIPLDDIFFDPELIMHINSVFTVLTQIGAGPESGYVIEGKDDLWDSFVEGDPNNLKFIKTYMYLKVRELFDPPQSSSLMEAFNRVAQELEWRISVTVDPGNKIPSK